LALGTLDKRERSATASLNLDWQRKKEKSKTGRPGKVGYNMKILKKNWILILATLAAVALVLFNLPGLKAWRLRALAAEQIKSYVDLLESSSPDSTEGFFYCLLPLFHEGSQPPTALNHATQWLEQAQRLDPKNSHGNFLLGQAYCLAEDYPEAIEKLRTFVQQRSSNPLGVAELGFAHISMVLSHSDSQQIGDELEIAKLLLEQAGFGEGFFETTGEKTYKQGNYQDALEWFGVAEKIAPLSEANNRKHALLKLAFEGETDIPLGYPIITMGENTEGLLIEPKLFFQLSNWQPANIRKTGDYEAAVIWSNSSIIGALIDVAAPSEYCLLISAIDQKPEPTQLAVYLNYKKLSEIELSEGDGQLREFQLKVALEKGASLISIKLLNDYYSASEGGRNGYIASVTISPCK
jgi:tetratricopeptide (TPR) repeat protein